MHSTNTANDDYGEYGMDAPARRALAPVARLRGGEVRGDDARGHHERGHHEHADDDGGDDDCTEDDGADHDGADHLGPASDPTDLALVPATEAALDRDPSLLCANLALCVVEILAGARSLDHIARWVTDAVFVQLLRRTVLASRARTATGEKSMRPRVRIGIPHTCPLGESVVEAVVVVHQRARSRAIAMRLERHRTRWRATAITVL